MSTTPYRPGQVLPRLDLSPYFDVVLKARRGPDGVEMDPQDAFAAEGENMCPSISAALALEACYWALGIEDVEVSSYTAFPMRPALTSGGMIVARGNVLKTGRQVSICEANIYQDNKLISRVMVNFTVIRQQA